MGEFMCSNSCIASLTSTFVKVRVETATGSQILQIICSHQNGKLLMRIK